jgi:hypothetical protein
MKHSLIATFLSCPMIQYQTNPGEAGHGSLPETLAITQEQQLIEKYFLHIKVTKFN